MFKVGQKVVCVDDNNAPKLKKGKTYVITGIDQCPGCQNVGLAFDFSDTHRGLHSSICQICGFEQLNSYSVEDFRASRFRPLQYGLIANKELIECMTTEKLDVKEKQLC